MTKTFCGDLLNEANEFIGCIHKTEGGFVVRKPIPFGRDAGLTLFEGRKFSGSDFRHVKTTNLGYAVVKSYRLLAA